MTKAKGSVIERLPIAEEPELATSEREACQKCALFQTCNLPFMPVYVPDGWTGRLLIIGEAPGADEDKAGRPFVGKSGKLLYQMLADAGIQEKDVAITNANRCRPVNNATPTLHQVRYCRPFAVHDVLHLRPRWVLCVGANAAKSVFNDGRIQLGKLRQKAFDGAEFFGEGALGVRVAFSYHPSAALRARRRGKDHVDYKTLILEDLRWLVGFQGYIAGPETNSPDSGPVALDIEWDKNYKLTTVSQAWGNKAEVTEDRNVWTQWLQDASQSERSIIGHSIFQDLSVCRLNGLSLAHSHLSGTALFDTLLGSRMDNENRGNYDLETATTYYCKVAPWKLQSDVLLKKQKIRDFWSIPADIRMERCKMDAWAAGLLAKELIPRLTTAPGLYTLLRFNTILASAFRRLEMTGVKVDEGRYNSLRSILAEHLETRAATLKAIAGEYNYHEFAPTNNEHFRELLYNRLSIEPVKWTEKEHEPSVDDAALILLYQDGNDELRRVIDARLQFQKASKLYTTYIGEKRETKDGGDVGLLKHLTGGYFIFPRINPYGARTGRRSSNKPNIQNWPKRMRAMVVSRYPGGSIVKGDEGQLEPRILAYVAGIEEWQELFSQGKSLYLHVAKRLWHQDVEKDTPLYRLTKSTILGTNYGMETDLFQEKLSIEQGVYLPWDEADRLLKSYHALYPELPRYFAIQKEKLIRDQQISALTGQIRHLPCPQGEKTPGFKHMWNQALNHPIQCLAAYVTGAALLDLEAAILGRVGLTLEQHYDNLVRFWGMEQCGWPEVAVGRELDYPLIIAEIHDELLTDCPPQHVEWMKEALTETMSAVPTLRRLWPQTKDLTLTAEVASGVSWAGK